MQWYYARDDLQVGPYTDEQYNELVRTGAIMGETLVWNETMDDWAPHATIAGPVPLAPSAELAAAVTQSAGPPTVGYVRCSMCGGDFAPNEVIAYEGASICAACKPRFMQQLREGVALPGVVEYGGFWIRFAAKFLDGIILYVVSMILSFIGMAVLIPLSNAGGSDLITVVIQGGQLLLQLAAGVAYTTFFLGKYGATPGKMACKLRVVRSNGNSLTYGRGFGRYFGDALSGIILYIGYIMVAFDEEKRALHDRICDTRVIKVG